MMPDFIICMFFQTLFMNYSIDFEILLDTKSETFVDATKTLWVDIVKIVGIFSFIFVIVVSFTKAETRKRKSWS